MIKVLIVDDSPLFSAMLSSKLSEYVDFHVVGTAADPYQARDKILELDPDIMTLDVEMPRMDGVSFLKRLLPQYNIPVIVVSSLESRINDAREAGAVSFRLKPSSSTGAEVNEFVRGVAEDIMEACKGPGQKPTLRASARAAAQRRTSAVSGSAGNVPSGSGSAGNGAAGSRSAVQKKVVDNSPVSGGSVSRKHSGSEREGISGFGKVYERNGIEIIALGASTGGTDALEKVVLGLNEECPPIVITQHMPPVFTNMYAQRLDRNAKMKVYEAKDGMRLEKGMCVIAAGGFHMELQRDARGYFITSKEGEKVSGHCPSVDVMFMSVAKAAGGKVVAALLTGMGADGAKGLLQLKKAGAYTIGQNKETCVVYGMPMEAYKMGAVCEEAPLDNIAGIILKKLRM